MAPRQAIIDALKEVENSLLFVSGEPPEPPYTADVVDDRLTRIRRWRAWVMWSQVLFCLLVGVAGLLPVSGVTVPTLGWAVLAGGGIGLAFGVRNLVYTAKAEQLYAVLLRLERDAESH